MESLIKFQKGALINRKILNDSDNNGACTFEIIFEIRKSASFIHGDVTTMTLSCHEPEFGMTL